MEGRVRIESRRFGPLELDERELIDFGGLPGFPGAKRFALLAHDERATFAWLVSADVPDLAFVVTDPWQFFATYEPAVPTDALRQLGREKFDELECLVIATVRPDGTTVNLAAPLLVNPETRRGRQVILDGDAYSTRASVPLPQPAPAR